MSAHMEMIFIDSAGHARKTGLAVAMESDAKTWRAFNHYRPYAVASKEAAFLLDYWNRRGELCQTIPLSVDGFKAITGEAVLSEARYVEIDKGHWRDVRLEVETQRFVSDLRARLQAEEG